MLADKFQYILSNYISPGKKVSNSTEVYSILVNEIPQEIKEFNPFRSTGYIVKGSMGQGNKTDYPWISILNRNITTSTKYGLYVVYLFKKDMSGFYLVLGQGITYFDEAYKRKKYEAARKVVEYFQERIDRRYFSKEKIDLVGTKKGSLGYGYEATTILSKYYASNNFHNNAILADLELMLSIYEEIYKNMDTDNYNDIIERIITFTKSNKDHLVDADTASKVIKEALEPIDGQPYDFSKQLIEVPPYVDRSTKYKEITNPLIRKTDYIKKAKKDAETGYLGEKLVIEYEKQRLINIGLGKYAEKIKWQSLKSDGFGYDVLSYDRIGLEVKPIYIEVKTTTNKVDCEFPVSKGEVDKSKELDYQYCIYRIYDVIKSPKFYRVFGKIENHFDLDPITFLAKYKG